MATRGVNGAGPVPGKKLKIKPLKLKPRLPANFVESTWAKLRKAIEGIFSEEKVSYSFEELYRAAEDLCLHKKAQFVYESLVKECESQVTHVLGKLTQKQSASFLSELEKEWQTHCNQLLTIRSIFLYLDRTFVLQNSQLKSIFDMGLQLFRKQIETSPATERTLSSGLVEMITQERRGDHGVDRKVLKSLAKMLLLLGLYSKHFEEEFLQETQRFYQTEGFEKMRELQVLDYLVHCEKRLGEEEEKCNEYLDSFTYSPLMKIVEECLLKKHLNEILQKGFTPMMDQLKIADLRRLYTLCERVGSLDLVRESLSAYVKHKAGDYVMDDKNDSQMVQNLINLKANIDKVVAECFEDKESFHGSLKEAFEYSINLRQNRPAELVAKYIDSKLRSGNKGGAGDEELETILDGVLVIFRYISGKDVFEAFYKKDLAKRLLLGKSSSIDAEKSTIGKFKTECGSQFTNKLEGMFKDIDISRDIMTGFKNSAQVQTKLKHGIELYVNVLTTGYWPTYPPLEANLPTELRDYQEIFKKYYLSKHSGRRLVWQNSLGLCVVKCKFKKSSKELVVSLFQTVVLMLYNDVDVLTYDDIEKATGIQEKELKRTLQSLSLGKVRVLIKDPKTKEVNRTDTFTFHREFTAPLYRLRINNIQMKETQEENQSTTERVFQDRQYQVDAAIVRVMKSRKTLSHTLLIAELFSQLRFPIKPADLKKRIESLIDREYLERDEQNPQVYNYLA